MNRFLAGLALVVVLVLVLGPPCGLVCPRRWGKPFLLQRGLC